MKSAFFIADYFQNIYSCTLFTTRNSYKIKPVHGTYQTICKNDAIYIEITSWELQYCLNELEYCLKLRTIIKHKLKRLNRPVILRTRPPDREIIDYKWNEVTTKSIWQKVETDHMMSWLSTLGGAFSALGDSFNSCADIAGKISVYQLKLAVEFDDPLIVCRSKLYYSLSLIQKNHLRAAKHLIREQYKYAKSVIDIDDRLIRMCHGIWMKLQYAYSQRPEKRKHMVMNN